MTTNNGTKIGVATATIIGMNAMIGSGIFTAPATMAANVGPAGILAYLFVVVSVWFMALSIARLAALFPEEGSFYAYAKQWGGHTTGMIAASLYLVGLFIAMGLLAQMVGHYSVRFFPTWPAQTLGLATLGILVLLNMFGVVLSQLGQHILIATTLFPLLVTTIICFSKADLANLSPFAPYGFTNVFKATRVVVFGFFGFECAASLFNIVQNPKRNVPRALTYSIVIVGLIYVLFVASLILSTPLEYFTGARVPLPDTLAIIFPNNNWILFTIHLSMLSAMVGTIHSMIWSSSALLISTLKKIKSNGLVLNQQIAVLIVGGCIFATCLLFQNLDLFFSLVATCIVLAYLLSMVTLLTMKQEWKSGQNIITLLGFATASAILFFAVEGLVQQVTKIIEH